MSSPKMKCPMCGPGFMMCIFRDETRTWECWCNHCKYKEFRDERHLPVSPEEAARLRAEQEKYDRVVRSLTEEDIAAVNEDWNTVARDFQSVLRKLAKDAYT